MIAYEFVYHCIYGHILYRLRDKTRYRWKIVIFIPLVHNSTLGKRLRLFSRCFFSPQLSQMDYGAKISLN